MRPKNLAWKEFAIGALAGCLLTGAILKSPIQSQSQSQSQPTKDPNKDKLFRAGDLEELSRYCPKGERQSSNAYGDWHSTKDCIIPANKSRPEVPVDEILFDNGGKLVAIKRVIVNEARHRFFTAEYGVSVKNEATTCSRYGTLGAPVLIVGKLEVCDAITYENI